MAKVGFKTKAVKEEERQDALPVKYKAKERVATDEEIDDLLLNRMTQVGLMKSAVKRLQGFMQKRHDTQEALMKDYNELTTHIGQLKNAMQIAQHE